MKKHLSTIILVLIFFVGLSVLLYPTVSNYVNVRHSTQVISKYDEAVANMTKEDYSSYFEAAENYNKALAEDTSAFFVPYKIEGYDTTLDITGTGIMGYITIDKINVQLPIYHGTDEGVLQVGAGHLEGTSFPIGGESTHAVISAHRGLPSATLFSNLDKLEVGDTFKITVLDRLFTYEVDDIAIVLPEEVDKLQIEEGKDLVTLLTCTPYGVNTHRLLVTGHRIENQETEELHVTAEAFKIEPIKTAPIMAIPLIVIMLIIILVKTKSKKEKRGEKNDD